jgi:hypothetical protein
MSRFKQFQNKQVFNEKGKPLYEQIYIYDFIINFEDGFIDNRYTELENGITPAISCIDGHIEYWEKGVLHNNDGPAVYSAKGIESWQNGKANKNVPSDDDEENKYKENNDEENEKIKEFVTEKGCEAEFAFAKYLNKKRIPFIRLEQFKGTLYSAVLRNKKIKRPDYMIFIDSKPLFIEVKATGCYLIKKKELEKLNALKNEFLIDVIFAITDINKEKFDDFNFTTLDTLNKYIAIIKNNETTDEDYPYSKLLLKGTLIHDTINDEELEKIYSIEGPYNKLYYTDILNKYIKDNNYTVKERIRKG